MVYSNPCKYTKFIALPSFKILQQMSTVFWLQQY